MSAKKTALSYMCLPIESPMRLRSASRPAAPRPPWRKSWAARASEAARRRRRRGARHARAISSIAAREEHGWQSTDSVLPPSEPTSSASTMPDVPSRASSASATSSAIARPRTSPICVRCCASARRCCACAGGPRARNFLERGRAPGRERRAAARAAVPQRAWRELLEPHSPSGRRSCTSAGSLENISDEAAAIGHVARAFVSVAPFFKLYSTYCQDYEAALQRLEALSRQPAFARYREEGGQDAAALESMLIKPIQRLCKYPLFFGRSPRRRRPANSPKRRRSSTRWRRRSTRR